MVYRLLPLRLVGDDPKIEKFQVVRTCIHTTIYALCMSFSVHNGLIMTGLGDDKSDISEPSVGEIPFLSIYIQRLLSEI